MARLTIVKDEPDRKRARRREIAVHLDGSAWLRVTTEELLQLEISDGQELDEAAAVLVAEKLARVRSRAFVVRSLAVRAQSVKEIEAKLSDRSIPPAIAAETIELARGYGYLDDEELAGQLARGTHGRGYGRFRAERLLRERGISATHAAAALQEAYGSESESALARAALGRRRPAETDAERRRAVAFLVRRGFSTGAAWEAVRAASRDVRLDQR